MSESLESVRRRIDEIDRSLQELLNERAKCALEVSHIKARDLAAGEALAFYRPEREAQILRRIRESNRGDMPPDVMARLFREIISSCLSLEQPLSVATLGPRGTFTEEAAVKHFGHFAQIQTLSSIDQVFREVESDAVHYGVVPVENTTEGMVNQTLDCLMDSTLGICGEVELAVHQMLLCQSGADPDKATEVVSHEQSLAQTRRWLDVHFPKLPRRAVSSNSEAARLAAESPELLAIGGLRAAEIYGLRILERNIEDFPDNKTRFVVVGKTISAESGEDKTSILVTVKNEPGALYQILGPFQELDVSLTRLETRPLKGGNWSYAFFIDFSGHRDQPNIGEALERVGNRVVNLRVLGSYPAAAI